MKNKILDNLPILFITLLVIFSLSLTYKHAKATEHPLFPDGVMTTTQVPIFCGSGPVVFSYASSIFKQKAIAWSDVKASGDPNSETFAWVSFWYSSELNNGSMFLTIKQTGQTCLMGYGMDWIFDTELLLDIVNDSIANSGDEQ
tara:strand:+ start:58 stop:489 length:432 start_codon:yes stop_codon:yes gene_type:complete